MKVANAVAEILKREGIEFLIGYPVNPIIEAAAEADIRTIMVRQERVGLHMCDAIAKVTSGDRNRRLRDAARPGHRERLWRGRAVLGRFLPGHCAAGRLCPQRQPGPPQLQRRAQFPQRHQMVRAGDGAERDRRGAAPRLHPGQEPAAGAGADRVSLGPAARGVGAAQSNIRRRRGSGAAPIRASGSPSPRRSCRRSAAASPRPARVPRPCSNSSPRRQSTSRASAEPPRLPLSVFPPSRWGRVRVGVMLPRRSAVPDVA